MSYNMLRDIYLVILPGDLSNMLISVFDHHMRLSKTPSKQAI